MAPPQGGIRRRPEAAGGGGVDRLSVLLDELLLLILGRVGAVGEAARTSVLARRWRGLWTGLLELTFRGVAPGSVEAALAQAAGPSLDLLDVRFAEEFPPEHVSSLLRAAARLAPKELAVASESETSPDAIGDDDVAAIINLPRLERTATLTIKMRCEASLALPAAAGGEFAALTSLSLTFCRIADLEALLALCPNLRALALDYCLGLGDDAIVHLPLLEELVIVMEELSLGRVDIEAPSLRKVDVKVGVEKEPDVSFSAPNVEQFAWQNIYEDIHVAFDQIWLLNCVFEQRVQGQQPYVEIHLRAEHPYNIHQQWNFEQAIAQMRFANFSVLQLYILAEGHIFGPMVLHLLRIRPVMQKLVISMDKDVVEETCSGNCPCKQHNNWSSESIVLTNLEVVEIEELKGKGHEVDLLKLLLRCTTALKRMTVRLHDEVSPSNNYFNEIQRIFKEYPNVECVVKCRQQLRRRSRTER